MRLRGVVVRRAKHSVIAKERKNLDVDVKIRSYEQPGACMIPVGLTVLCGVRGMTSR